MDRMAILIGNDRGADLVPMLEREGLRVEVTRSPEQALERLQEMLGRPAGFSESTEGNGSRSYTEGWDPAGAASGVGLDRRLAAVQERARALESEEQRIISDALQQASGNKTAAARLLGISRYALQRRLRRFAKPQTPQTPSARPAV
jgi:transcriptional regulator of acetoin/glycerol metabolism